MGGRFCNSAKEKKEKKKSRRYLKWKRGSKNDVLYACTLKCQSVIEILWSVEA